MNVPLLTSGHIPKLLPEPVTVRNLVCRNVAGLVREVGWYTYSRHLGMLIRPGLGSSPQMAIDLGAAWAIDNGAFANFDRVEFINLLKSLRRFRGCAWCVAPDVVADAQATLTRFAMWHKVIRHYGFPVALAAQDGLESLTFDWSLIDCLFIGGSTDWKLSEHALKLAHEAKARGKWVHVGRVNSQARIDWIKAMKADSFDGTRSARFSRDFLPQALKAMPRPYTQSLWERMIA